MQKIGNILTEIIKQIKTENSNSPVIAKITNIEKNLQAYH
jgi:hypothetical protein